MENIVKNDIPPMNNYYSDDLNSLIQKLLVKDPDRRPFMFQIMEFDFVETKSKKYDYMYDNINIQAIKNEHFKTKYNKKYSPSMGFELENIITNINSNKTGTKRPNGNINFIFHLIELLSDINLLNFVEPIKKISLEESISFTNKKKSNNFTK